MRVVLLGLSLITLPSVLSPIPAAARARHHPFVSSITVARAAPFDRERSSRGSQENEFGGQFETGIVGATTADPYERAGD